MQSKEVQRGSEEVDCGRVRRLDERRAEVLEGLTVRDRDAYDRPGDVLVRTQQRLDCGRDVELWSDVQRAIGLRCVGRRSRCPHEQVADLQRVQSLVRAPGYLDGDRSRSRGHRRRRGSPAVQDGDHVIRRLCEIHDTVDDQRCRQKAVQGLGLEHPFHFQILDVRRIDLAKWAVALAGVGAGVHQPVLGFVGGASQAIEGDLRMERGGRQRDE